MQRERRSRPENVSYFYYRGCDSLDQSFSTRDFPLAPDFGATEMTNCLQRATVNQYQLAVTKSGYQQYRSANVDVVDEPVHYDVPLTPLIAEAAGQVIEMSEAGFSPAVLTVKPGAVIEWVNVGTDSHTATSVNPAVPQPAAASGGWDSGLLAAGESYKFRFNAEGTYTYQDTQNPANTATIIVQQADNPAESQRVFLPVINR